MQRKLNISGLAVKMNFESKLDPKTFKKHSQQFKGIVQIEVESSGDFSGLTTDALENLIVNYFKAHPTITLYDFIRTITN